MCGIYGFKYLGDGIFDRSFELMYALNQNSISRGQDSMGVAVLKDGHIKRKRMVGHPYSILSNPKNYQIFDKFLKGVNVLIGHTRYANRGVINYENAHPFANKNVALVHNGTISEETLWGFTEVQQLHKPLPDSDSRSVFRVINHLSPDKTPGGFFDGFVKATSLLNDNDAYAFAYLHKDFLALTHNNERPLCVVVVKPANVLVFASTKKIVEDSINAVYGKDTFKNDCAEIKIAPNEMLVCEDSGMFQFSWEPPIAPFKERPEIKQYSGCGTSTKNYSTYGCNYGNNYSEDWEDQYYPGKYPNELSKKKDEEKNGGTKAVLVGRDIDKLYVKVPGFDKVVNGDDIVAMKKMYERNKEKMSWDDREQFNRMLVSFFQTRDIMVKQGAELT